MSSTPVSIEALEAALEATFKAALEAARVTDDIASKASFDTARAEANATLKASLDAAELKFQRECWDAQMTANTDAEMIAGIDTAKLHFKAAKEAAHEAHRMAFDRAPPLAPLAVLKASLDAAEFKYQRECWDAQMASSSDAEMIAGIDAAKLDFKAAKEAAHEAHIMALERAPPLAPLAVLKTVLD